MTLFDILNVAQIIIQAAAAFVGLRAYFALERRSFWLVITIAFTLMTFRRITALLIGLGYSQFDLGIIDRAILPFAISVLLLIGITGVYQRAMKREGAIGHLETLLERYTSRLESLRTRDW
jgi:ABC-type multidrug transport system fused ATPase/permease subunit